MADHQLGRAVLPRPGRPRPRPRPGEADVPRPQRAPAPLPARQDHSYSQVRSEVLKYFFIVSNIFPLRHHTRGRGRHEPAYQGVWADNKDFDEVLISKRMLQVCRYLATFTLSTLSKLSTLSTLSTHQDHMPDNVLDALEKASQVHAWHSAVNTVNIARTHNSSNNNSNNNQVPEHLNVTCNHATRLIVTSTLTSYC